MGFIPPTPQRFNANQQIVDPTTGFAANVFLRFVNGIRDVVAYITTVDTDISAARAIAEAAQVSADSAQASADAAQGTADGATLAAAAAQATANDAAPQVRNLTAGNGLTGGGDLTNDRAFAVGAGIGITVNADDVAIDTNYLSSGTYTPTATMVGNVSAVTPYLMTWTRIGDVVEVSGWIDIDPIAAGPFTDVRLSLPVPSNFTAAIQCHGHVTGNIAAGQTAGIVAADVANDAAYMSFITSSAAVQGLVVSFSYQVLP